MCGISGLVNLHRPVGTEHYYPNHLRLRHRGLDDEGFFVANNESSAFYRGNDTISDYRTQPHIETVQGANVVLGHRRLAIIDLSPGGHQPIQDGSGRYTMVYNGEIYNYIELRQELIKYGHNFHTQSDSEVLLAAFAEWDTGCFNHFNGMWAVAIYDAVARRLILSRDRYGIKPLYYTIINDTLYFGSEVKFLLPFLPELRMNEPRVLDYLVRYVVDHDVETMFENIYQLAPAHYAVFDTTGLTARAYWSLPADKLALSLTDACDQLHELLKSAIQLRLRSDVPVGSLLSGGLDSTTIVCLVQQLLTAEHATNSFESFSAVFNEEEFSERCYIEDTVAQTKLPVHWIYPDPNLLAETLPQLLYHQEFPLRSLAVYSQWTIMEKVRCAGIRVLLNGQGSDEIFGGYTAHYPALIASYIQRGRLKAAWQEGQSFVRNRNASMMSVAQSIGYHFGQTFFPGLIFRRRPRPFLRNGYQPDEKRTFADNMFDDALVRNLTYSALPEYLRYEDRNSMAFTLESRLPFLDFRLVEWAMRLPAALKIKDVANKRVLRTMAQPLIPASISARRDKMGFVSPQYQWQHRELKQAFDQVFAQDLQQRFSFLNGPWLQDAYGAYQQKETGDTVQGGLFWKIFCLASWHDVWWGV